MLNSSLTIINAVLNFRCSEFLTQWRLKFLTLFQAVKQHTMMAETLHREDEAHPEICTHKVSHNNKILDKLQQLWENKQLIDVSLKVGTKQYPVHKVVLCSASEVFCSMFVNSAWKESTSQEVELHELPECEKVFGDFVKYFYSGKILLTLRNVVGIHSLSSKYQVCDLENESIKFMEKMIELPKHLNHVILFYKCAKMYNLGKLKSQCRSFIMSNFELVAGTLYWSSLDKWELIDILQWDNIIVKDEFKVFLAVQSWIASQDMDDTKRKETTAELIKHIRFNFIHPNNLLLLESEPLVKEYFTDLFQLPLLEAYKFQGVKKCWRNKGFLESFSNVTPRIYINVESMVEIQSENWEIEFHTSVSHSAADNKDVKWICAVDGSPYGKKHHRVLSFAAHRSSNHDRFKMVIVHRYMYYLEVVCKIVSVGEVNIAGQFSLSFSIAPPKDINFTRHREVGLILQPCA